MTNRNKRHATGSGNIATERSDKTPVSRVQGHELNRSQGTDIEPAQSSEGGGSVARRVWYILSNTEGKPYCGTRCATRLMIDPSVEDVDGFRAQILQVHASELQGLTKDRLLVYRTKSDFASGSIIAPDLSMNALGQSFEEALIVVVPDVKRRRRGEELSTPSIAPDSERITEILPEETRLMSSDMMRLHFVNREQPMKNLLKIHCSILARRSGPCPHSGDSVQIPLMDSLFGMGKTTFAWRYLAMVARYVETITVSSSQVAQEILDDEMLNRLINDILQAHALSESLVMNEPIPLQSGSDSSVAEQVTNFPGEVSFSTAPAPQAVIDPGILRVLLSELRCARTLHIDCSRACLSNVEQCGTNLTNATRRALKAWGVTVPSDVKWEECRDTYIAKPVFIVFDNIGKAFEAGSADVIQQRESFLRFVGIYCDPLSRYDGIHYLLCGHADFLRDVGIQPDEESIQDRYSPVLCQRINLTPIRREYIKEIFEKTYFGGIRLDSLLLAKCPVASIEEIIEKLYIQTGGNPRSLRLSVEHSTRIDPQNNCTSRRRRTLTPLTLGYLASTPFK